MPDIVIAGRKVGRGQAPFIVAEAGVNHNGELLKALEMVRVAKDAGADAVKFQTFKAEEIIVDPTQTYSYTSQGKDVTESMLAMFRRLELPRDAWRTIKAECDKQGIVFLSTPQNRSDLDLLLDVGVPAVKVGSDDFTNLPLLKSYAKTGLPLILSFGMADMDEVKRSLEAVGAAAGYPVVLLLCTSQYPTPAADANLARLNTLRATFPSIALGFSDHTQGHTAACVAVALGATVFEKHFTLGRDLPGPDHWFSESPADLRDWVRSIRDAYTMLGNPAVQPTDAERDMRKIARRSVVALRSIASGEAFTLDNVALRRPGTGLPPEYFDTVLGRHARRNFKAGEPLSMDDIR